MNTTKLKKFAQSARRQLLEQVSARLEQVLRSDSVEIREKARAVAELKAQIGEHGKSAVIDQVAYTWFNRFCALRFMDVNHYTRVGAVSPAEGGTQPEVLLEAKQGQVDDDLKRFVNQQTIFSLLNGQRPASDPQGEAYRLLLVGVCNSYNAVMPFLFEKIEDYTELLMPLDLLSENSVLHDLRDVLTTETCQDVEVIGWLYQYYISERKDQVFEALKQNQKIEAADIPAATQLFTPHWIVRYLVENSLGRLWMLNHPDSKLVDQMEYYIDPVIASAAKQSPDNLGLLRREEHPPRNDMEEDFLHISSPEELKLLDPACGSGHMLTNAFDLLYAIYAEQGYAANEIPQLILEKNIFGIEIDPRAGALAAFALCMKARAKDKRFFTRAINPNICVLENVTFTEAELKQYMNAVGRDLFTEPLMETLRQFEQADNFGSLIRPVLTDAAYVRDLLEGKNLGGDLFLFGVHERVLKVLKQAEFLAPRYHVVAANPPYMSSAGFSDELKEFANDFFPDSKSDTYAMFIERTLGFIQKGGMVAMITIPNWMFLTSFEKLRELLFRDSTIISLVDNGRGIWGSDFGSCSFVLSNIRRKNNLGVYKRLYIKQGSVSSNETLQKRFFDNEEFPRYMASSEDFGQIPGSPVAYWIDKDFLDLIGNSPKLGDICPVKEGLNTGNNDRFLRYWQEVSISNIGIGKANRSEAKKSGLKWFPCNKGGAARRWYGNNEYVLNWFNDGEELFSFPSSAMRNVDYYFKEGITWSGVSIALFSGRYFPVGHIFNSAGRSLLPQKENIWRFLGLLNSKVGIYYFKIVAPTPSFTVGNVASFPVKPLPIKIKIEIDEKVKKAVEITEADWDNYEESWNFKGSPFLANKGDLKTVEDTYNSLKDLWRKFTEELLFIEEFNNNNFIKAYRLQNDLTPKVSIKDIILTCNPHNRYGGNKSDAELEGLLRADTMKEFISYAVGCMFGRYSLDKPGLVLANQGEGIDDFRLQMEDAGVAWEDVRFAPDEDNVIPVLEGEWFMDDMPTRFKQFLRTTFGDEHYEENLAFIEASIGRDIRNYFVKDFYKEHVQMYKKRPIYWMFSSPKGSFNALIYMHRYQPDTVSIILNDYLREYIKKLQAHKSHLEMLSVSAGASQSQKTKSLKEIAQVTKILAELKDYESDVLFPLANERIQIDLDDGVKVNYAKLGKALSPISGL